MDAVSGGVAVVVGPHSAGPGSGAAWSGTSAFGVVLRGTVLGLAAVVGGATSGATGCVVTGSANDVGGVVSVADVSGAL
ncbi:hypothetical protein F9C11_14085 [Amycolatopsis sp. VS8301801F10]|uniref:hypothetical protein n=1 Tax=Amycolatopsis sp. VS8301801F10 TaxID=2652442 RepID=UPI0038FC13E3